MATKKKSENLLSECFESLVQKSGLDYLKYEYFDFHSACKGQKFEHVDVLIENVKGNIENLNFYAAKVKSESRVLLNQQGVVRVNCLDCLDRTNIVMTKIAALMLDRSMRHMNTDLKLALGTLKSNFKFDSYFLN